MLNPSSLVGRQIDQFRLDQFIARGAMGMVFKAFDSVLVRTVALKLISRATPDGLSSQEIATIEEARKRLIQEAKAAGRLSHPNIVTIHSYGETDEFEYICMEYVSGRTLAQILNAEKVIDPERTPHIFEQILLALEAANKEQIVHRDIKPSNIMMTEDGRVKVMDFGIAKLPSLSMTITGTVLGTPYYMSPEQISGQKIDIRSDLFSLGAVLYEAVTGERPFAAANTATLAYKIVQTDPIPPKVLNVHIPQELGRIISKALTKDPAKRYQTPREMLLDLRATVQRNGEAMDPSDATIMEPPPVHLKDIENIGERARQVAAPAESGREGAEATPARQILEGSEPAKGDEVSQSPVPQRQAIGKEPKVLPATPSSAKSEAHEKKPASETSDERPAPRPLKTKDVDEPQRAKPGSKEQSKPGKPAVLFAAVFVLLIIGVAILFMMRSSPTPSQQLGRPIPEAQRIVPQIPPTDDQSKGDADSLVLQAKDQMEKNPVEARRLLEDALAKDPRNFEANFQLGRLLTFQKDFSAAIPQFLKALDINKQSAEVYFNLGYIYLSRGEYDTAISNYETCWSLSPPFLDEVLTNLGIAYLHKNNSSQAQSFFRQALVINLNNNVARNYLAGATSGSVPQKQATSDITMQQPTSMQPSAPSAEQGDTAAAAQRDNSVASLLSQAKSQSSINPGESEKLFREAISLDPNNLEALLQLGRLLTLKKDYTGAVQYYQNALRINKQSPEAYFNLGFVYLSQGAYDSAKKNYEACLALSPPFKDEVLTNLGIIELKKKNLGRARQLFREALDLNPNNAIAKTQLSNLGGNLPSRR